MSLTLDTPVLQLPQHGVARLGAQTARRLALALANVTGKRDASETTVEDLLSYLPMRYEDRSNLARIADLSNGVEASLELYVRVAGGYQVGKNRGPKAPPLFIFEVTAGDPERTGKPVVIKWFVSGRQARRIIAYHRQRFTRGARFIAFGKWEWDSRNNTFALMLNKPADELEMLPGTFTPPENALIRIAEQEAQTETRDAGTVADSNNNTASASARADAGVEDDEDADEESDDESAVDEATDPALAAIHVGRRVPVYRKLGEFRTKRLREIMHAVLGKLDDEAFKETLPAELITRQHLASRADATRRIHFPVEDVPLADYERARSPAHLRLIFEEFFWVALAIALRRDERVKEPKGEIIEITDRVRASLMSVLPFALTAAQERAVTRILEDMQSDVPMNRLLQGDVGSGKTAVALLAMLAALENGYQAALMVPTEILAEQHARNIKRMLAPTPYRVELLIGSLKASEKKRLHRDLAAGEVHVVVGEDRRAGVYKGIEREVRAGRQAYVVYPLVEESEKMDLKDATRMYEHLRDRVFPHFTVGLLHGRMKPSEKEEAMRRFVGGEIQVLVATTVVEVGVDVPNASVMIVEHAERFGLSQLHQLRGRVGRGAEQSYCVLMSSDKQTSVAQQRLGIMAETNDGFRIAEKDLEIRGPGEVMGTRQSGVPTFRVGNLVRDVQILEEARREADYYLTSRRMTRETSKLIKRIRADARFGLAAIG